MKFLCQPDGKHVSAKIKGVTKKSRVFKAISSFQFWDYLVRYRTPAILLSQLWDYIFCGKAKVSGQEARIYLSCDCAAVRQGLVFPASQVSDKH
jgi:hypothetical protein